MGSDEVGTHSKADSTLVFLFSTWSRASLACLAHISDSGFLLDSFDSEELLEPAENKGDVGWLTKRSSADSKVSGLSMSLESICDF